MSKSFYIKFNDNYLLYYKNSNNKNFYFMKIFSNIIYTKNLNGYMK